LENFQPPPPTERKKLKFPSRRRRSPKNFLAAAAEGRKKLKISSRRRRERHRLTPLVAKHTHNLSRLLTRVVSQKLTKVVKRYGRNHTPRRDSLDKSRRL
jgi:hypothetical protein